MRDYPLDKHVLPMGGTSVKDGSKLEAFLSDPNYIAEEKWDGSRYSSIFGRFFSRRISDVDGIPVEKTDRIPHLAEHLSIFPGIILDGELYIPGKTSNEVTSILGAKADKAIERQEEQGNLLYMVYDILMLEGEWLIDKPWHERRAVLERVFPMVANDYMKLSQYVRTDKKEFLESILARGGEGVMLKNVNGKYVPGKKPAKNWIKVKTEIDDDVVIIGFKDAVREYTGKEIETWSYWLNPSGEKELVLSTYEVLDVKLLEDGEQVYMPIEGWVPVTKFFFNDWVGAVKFGKFNEHGNLIELGECSGITEELRKDMSENPDKYIGEVMEIKAMQKTKDGFYRHPQFSRMRDDKNASECVL